MEPSRTHRGEHEHWPFDRQGDSREYHHWATSVYSRLKSAAPPTRKSTFTVAGAVERATHSTVAAQRSTSRCCPVTNRLGRPACRRCPGKAQLHNVPICWPCDLPVCRRHPGGTPGKRASNAPQHLDVKAEEVSAVEVQRTGGMMPSPATELVALGWCARPVDTGPARSMEGTACHGSGPAPLASQHCPSRAVRPE